MVVASFLKIKRVMRLCGSIFLGLLIVFAGQGDLPADAFGFYSITGPCNLEFPEDHGTHPGYQVEWWYYTGNLKSEKGRRFGFQLTFFRYQLHPPGEKSSRPAEIVCMAKQLTLYRPCGTLGSGWRYLSACGRIGPGGSGNCRGRTG